MSSIEVRALAPVDTVGYLLRRGLEPRNRAWTLSRVVDRSNTNSPYAAILRSAITPTSKRCASICVEGVGTVGFASATRRSGNKSWEISQLYAAAQAEKELRSLFEDVAKACGTRAVERVFLRLLRDDPLVDVARLSGYFPCYEEELFTRRWESTASRPTPSSQVATTDQPRLKAASDEYPLFRLYNAATPAEVRKMVGMTLEQWQSSQENVRGKGQDFVYDSNGGINCQLRIGVKGKSGQILALARADDDQTLADAITFSQRWSPVVEEWACLVPEYQPRLGSILSSQGFKPVSEFVVLVKSMKATAMQDARSGASVASVR